MLNDPFKTIVEAKKKALSGSNSNIWCAISYKVKTLLLRNTQKVE